MASNLEFVEYICEQVAPCGGVRYRKMFGDYMVYVNDKPLLLLCDNTVYAKQLEVLGIFSPKMPAVCRTTVQSRTTFWMRITPNSCKRL